MKLTRNELKSAIIGMIIGDGCLSKHTDRKKNKTGNAYYQMTHCEAQLEYLQWKMDILNNISKCSIYPNEDKRTGKMYYRLYSRANPIYTKLYDRFYQYGKKSVDEYIIKMITPLALSIMYMDDGCIGKANPKSYTKETFYLCLDNFDYANLFLIKKSLKIKFDLDWNINRTSRKYYQLRLLNKHNEKFVKIIKPYIINSMNYKLGSYAESQ